MSQTKKEGASGDDADASPQEEALWGEIRAADEIQDVTQRRHAIEAVTAKLAGESAKHPTASLFWLLGYAWYLHPDRMTSTPIQKRLEAPLDVSSIRFDFSADPLPSTASGPNVAAVRRLFR